MSRISDEDVRKVREANDLVSIIGERVPLKQRGRDFWCCCPFHQEKTPSCKIDPATQLWHCFGCGEGGDVFGFIMKADDISFPDAVRQLAERAHIDIAEDDGKPSFSNSQKARLRAICAATEGFYHTQLMRGKSQKAQEARDYLASRNLGGEVPKIWHLGFAPGNGELVKYLRSLGFTPQEMITANVAVQNSSGVRDRFYDRIMFPIFDAQGECIAFGGRIIGSGEPKYLNSQETPLFHKSSVLYGLNLAKAAMSATGDAIVVEGYTDVISLHQAGIENVVATLGTALTLQHIRLLSRHASRRIVYLFDGDAAGQRAADRALQFINYDMTPEAGKTRIELCAVTLPDDLDPADFVNERGADALKQLVADAQPLVSYGIERRLATHDLSSVEGRTRAFIDAIAVLAPIKDSLLAKDYAIQLAGRLQMREEDALSALSSLKAPTNYEENAKDSDVSRSTAEITSPTSLTSAEVSRRRIERRLLGLLAQNPRSALEHSDILAVTDWHDPANGVMAEAILEAIAADAKIPPAELINKIAHTVPSAAGALTAAQVSEKQSLEQTIVFLAEELEIGDLEASIAQMNAQLKDENNLSVDERDIIFHALVDLQRSLATKRKNHKPVID